MKVKFVPQNIEVDVTPEKSLLQIATENQIEIKSICKGVPSCAECRVRVIDGESNVLPPNKTELNLIGTNWRIDGRRLSCQMRCFGDVTVDLTEQLERQESQNKKVRGFRSQKQQTESHAVQDTILLTEKPEIRSEPQRQESQQDSRPEHKQNNRQDQRRNQNQKQKQDHRRDSRPPKSK